MQHMEAAERKRIEESKKMINDDFIDSNRQIIEKGKKTRALQNSLKKSD